MTLFVAFGRRGLIISTSRRRTPALIVATFVLTLAAGLEGAGAAPDPQPDSLGRPTSVLTDRDGDRISDGLELMLGRARPGDRFAVVATFRTPAAARSARATVRRGSIYRSFRLIDGFAADTTAGRIRALARRPGVVRVEEDFAVGIAMESADRDFGTERARSDFAATGAGIEICIVDTGVDPTHEQLDSKAPIPFKDYVNSKTTAYDDQGHGTHVASIAAGDGSGGQIAALFNGVAPASSLSAVKVLDSTGFGQDSTVVLGVQWCAARASVDVINVSITSELGSDGLDAISQAVDAAVVEKGKVVVAAAGNTGDLPGSVAAPASARRAITVGAVSDWSAPVGQPWRSEGPFLAFFSSRGPTSDGRIKPDVVAPGDTIAAAAANAPDSYTVGSGTSMAAPFVSGTAALLLQLQPTWAASDVRAAIEGTALDVGPAGKDNDWGAGILDGYAAVALAAGGTGETTFPSYQRFTGSVGNNGTWTTAFVLGPDDLDAPIAATITLNGSATCVLPWFDNQCLAWDWRPDLEAELIGPSGVVIADSTCAADDECSSGRQETLHFTPASTGTYTIRIRPATGSPNNGQGGSFAIDLFTGPAGTSPPPPTPSVHVGDLDGSSKLVTGGWRAFAVVRVHDGDHALVEGAVVTGTWSGGTSATCTTDALGKCRTGKKFAKRKLSATFTVTDVASAVGAHEPADNHDPDGDSNGTKITVLRP